MALVPIFPNLITLLLINSRFVTPIKPAVAVVSPTVKGATPEIVKVDTFPSNDVNELVLSTFNSANPKPLSRRIVESRVKIAFVALFNVTVNVSVIFGAVLYLAVRLFTKEPSSPNIVEALAILSSVTVAVEFFILKLFTPVMVLLSTVIVPNAVKLMVSILSIRIVLAGETGQELVMIFITSLSFIPLSFTLSNEVAFALTVSEVARISVLLLSGVIIESISDVSEVASTLLIPIVASAVEIAAFVPVGFDKARLTDVLSKGFVNDVSTTLMGSLFAAVIVAAGIVKILPSNVTPAFELVESSAKVFKMLEFKVVAAKLTL